MEKNSKIEWLIAGDKYPEENSRIYLKLRGSEEPQEAIWAKGLFIIPNKNLFKIVATESITHWSPMVKSD